MRIFGVRNRDVGCEAVVCGYEIIIWKCAPLSFECALLRNCGMRARSNMWCGRVGMWYCDGVKCCVTYDVLFFLTIHADEIQNKECLI